MRKCNGAAVAGATAIRKQTKKNALFEFGERIGPYFQIDSTTPFN